MRKDFEGIEADAQYGLTTRGDGQKTALSLTAGTNFAEGRGNITINGTYRKEQAVYQGARGYSFDALAAADFSPGGSFTNAPGFVDLGPAGHQFDEIGRASCRERVSQYLEISVVAGSLQQTKHKLNIKF